MRIQIHYEGITFPADLVLFKKTQMGGDPCYIVTFYIQTSENGQKRIREYFGKAYISDGILYLEDHWGF